MKKILYFIFAIAFYSQAQVNFTSGETLISTSHYSSNISAIASADLNNDGFKELIVGSYYDNAIMFYKNINGDLQHQQRQILVPHITTSYYSQFNIVCKDIDGDGLKDIVVAHSDINQVFWHKNQGDFKFDGKRTLEIVNRPQALFVADIDKDGDNDIIVGSRDDNKITVFYNNGLYAFLQKNEISMPTNGIKKIELVDLDKNGFLDIISGHEDGSIYWTKNLGNLIFSTPEYITGTSDDGTGFGFLNIDEDSNNYQDIVFTSNYDDNIKYLINDEGKGFKSETIIDNTTEDPYNLIVKDYDKDGHKDLIVSYTGEDKIAWFKNNRLGNFSSLKEITKNVTNPKYILVEDIDNDNTLEVISASYQDNKSEGQKLSVFKKVPNTNTYKENIINFYLSAVNVVKIADLNNDGKKDIITGFQSILWNKNYGNNQFSSHYMISNDNKGLRASDIQIKDLNSDGWLDVIGTIEGKVEVYKNNNGTSFELIFSHNLNDDSAEKIEIKDINKNGHPDILVSHRRGSVSLSKIINNGNFNFSAPTHIYSNSRTGFKGYNFKSADIDKDGHNDIVVGEGDVSELLWLKNDGTGNFTNHTIATSIACNTIDIGDVDNDGLIDIVVTSNSDSGASDFNWIKRTSNGFTTPTKIDTQSLKSLKLGDINNDGFLDIVGTTYEYPTDERIIYYLFNNNTFQPQVTVESLGTIGNLTRNISLGDLNNDNKLDIVSSYYFSYKVKYFINSSTLAIEDYEINGSKQFNVFPNPTSNTISWDSNLNVSTVIIQDLTGKTLYKNNINTNQLNISFLKQGIYILSAQSNNTRFTSKVIVK